MPMPRVWILLFVSLAAPAAAQDDGPFSELVQLVGSGDDVRVTLAGGRELTGQITAVTPDTLSVVSRGVYRDLGGTDVWTVYHRLKDSNATGGWLGFAAGAAYGVHLVMAIWETPPPDTSEVIMGLSVFGGAFGAVGAWGGYTVDRLIRREERVYSVSSGPRLTVVPVLSPDRRGVAVSLGF